MQHVELPFSEGKEERGKMAEGTVKWFGPTYGFISQDNDEGDVFVHHKNIVKDNDREFAKLEEGQRVSFDVGPGQDGKMQAMNVVKL